LLRLPFLLLPFPALLLHTRSLRRSFLIVSPPRLFLSCHLPLLLLLFSTLTLPVLIFLLPLTQSSQKSQTLLQVSPLQLFLRFHLSQLPPCRDFTMNESARDAS
jgi:hypothetical protein